MNVLVSGLLWSGSSAVLDMLDEYKSVSILTGEFDDFRRPGMIADHLSGRISNIYPSQIEKYLKRKEKFNIDNRYNSNIDGKELRRLRATKKFIIDVNNKTENESIIELGRNWFNVIKEAYIEGKEFLAIDQPILLGQHFDIWPEVLSPFKLIVVYREPKDQIAQIIKQNHLFLHMRSPDADIYGGDRIGAIKYQVETLKARLNWLDKIQKHHGEDKVITISFEMFINHHEKIRKALENWLGLQEKDKEFKKLKLNESVKNIGIYPEYLTKKEVLLLDEIYESYLEREKNNLFYKNLV